VQDSSQEWFHESQNMMQYYEMAQFTIVPLESRGSETGFVKDGPRWASTQVRWSGPMGSPLEFHFPSFEQLREGRTMTG
jgi:hypothetical protein